MALSKIIKLSWLLLLLGALGLLPNTLIAQDEEGEEEVEQVRSRASLSCVQKNDGVLDLKALIRAKIDDRYTGLPGLEVEFFTTTDTSETSLGKATTDEKGIATFTTNAKEMPRDTGNRMAFYASFEGNEEYSGSDADITLKPASFALEALEEDSSYSIQLTLMSGDEPVAEEDVSLFVKRLFFPLKVGEGSTDEDGMATIDFPTDLPGDAEGNLNIFARLEDSDDYGTVEASVTKAWGIPVSDRLEDQPRALWSPNPPLWMLLTFLVLMVTVWGHYIVIVYKLFQVKKEGQPSGG
ncbi:MAG: hypothetical protein H6566_05045 [Lewinellaceae bacterium]|nr:hypothetical protein [Lewinellaceae bacterium]